MAAGYVTAINRRSAVIGRYAYTVVFGCSASTEIRSLWKSRLAQWVEWEGLVETTSE